MSDRIHNRNLISNIFNNDEDSSEDEEYNPIVNFQENPNCTIVNRLMGPFYGKRTAAKRAIELYNQNHSQLNTSLAAASASSSITTTTSRAVCIFVI